MLLYYFIASVLLAVLVYFMTNIWLKHLLSVMHALLTAGLTYYQINHIHVEQLEFFKPDSLAIIFLTILSFVTLMASIHYISYSRKGEVPHRFIGLHNAGAIFFTMSLVGVLLTNHFGVLWAFLEITTLSAAVLIQHDRNKSSMEATWKYVYVASIAIALAFAGIMFLGFSFEQGGKIDLSYANVKVLAPMLTTGWMKACFLFVLTGFSVKMGLVPLFNVDIDAKDTSPSPVGAMLSSVLMNAGFVAIIRFYSAFSTSSILPWMNNVLMISGVISLFFAAVYIVKIKNVKRILAYSSMEHASLVILAFSSAGFGYFAAIFHLCLHALVKSTLFFQIGQMHNIYGSKQDSDIRGYLNVNPLGALVLLTGVFSAMAFPPSGIFISEFMMFQAIFDAHHWRVLALALLFVVVILYGLTSKILPMLFSHHDHQNVNVKGIRIGESILQLAIILVVFYIGMYRPDFIVDYINSAVTELFNNPTI